MLVHLKIAIRNVLRNKRRTLITLSAIVFGVVSLMLFGGYMDFSFKGLRESFIRGRSGHLQLYREGYYENKHKDPLKFTIDRDDYDAIKKIIEQEKHIDFAMRRLEFSGLISNGENSFIFIGRGIEPAQENMLGIGTFVQITEGRTLSDGNQDGVILGKGLAKQLDVPIGEYLTIMTTTIDGALNAIDVKLTGVFNTGIKDYDDRALMVPLAASQNLLYTNDVQGIVVVLDRTENTELVARNLMKRFKDSNLHLEIKTWSELADYYHKVVDIFNGIYGFLKIVIAIIVISSIANTMMMSVFERTREIGTIRALGTKRGGVLNLFILEALTLGVTGGILGLFFGAIACKAVSAMGLTMPPPPGYSQGYPLGVNIVFDVMVFAFILSVVTSLVSGLFPARKASKLEIVDALRHI